MKKLIKHENMTSFNENEGVTYLVRHPGTALDHRPDGEMGSSAYGATFPAVSKADPSEMTAQCGMLCS